MLEREPDFAVLWELGSAAELPRVMFDCPVDALLIDLNLGPDEDALAAATSVLDNDGSVRVIVISASLDWEAAAASRAAGASGYLPKDLAADDMVAAIRALASPNFGRSGFHDLLASRSSSSRGLTARRGLTNREIATRLYVSVSTVNKHVQSVLKKLHVRTRAQAMAMMNAEAAGRPYTAGGNRRS
jgi:DNA-binding NarL/FixJ family response regulator